MKKRGFTLIELLAVIVILGVIALIATPIVLNVVETSKEKSNMNSAYGLIDAGRLYYSESLLNEEKANNVKNVVNLWDEISVAGNKPRIGDLYVNDNGDVALSVMIENVCYQKTFTGELTRLSKEECGLGYIGPDVTAPTVTFTVLGNPFNEHNWAKEDFYVKIEVRDTESGVESFTWCQGTGENCNPTTNIIGDGGTVLVQAESNNNKICVIGKDKNENVGEPLCSNKYQLDKTAPSLYGVNNLTTFMYGNINLTSGVYGIDSLSGIYASYTFEPSSIDTNIEGNNTINYKLSDRAGNETVSTRTITLKQPFGFDVATKTITSYNSSAPKDVVIPSSINGVAVEQIDTYVFSSKKLTSVIIPNSVTNIKQGAFEKNQLTNVVIPSSVTTIGMWAFEGNQLQNLSISNSVTSIGMYSFKNNQLTSVTIPSNVTKIDSGAFENNQLTSIVIPSSVTSIGMYAFKSNQLTSIAIPNSVISIRGSAFNDNQLPDSQAFIYNRNSNGTENKTILSSYGGAKRHNVEIPSSVTSMEMYALAFNKITSVTIPSGVMSISISAFYDNQLASVIIPNSVVRIEESAFSSNQLTSVVIPNSVTSIGKSAFYGNKLTSVTIPSNVTNIGDGAFNNNQFPDESAFIYNRNVNGTEDKTTVISYGGAKRSNVVIPSNITNIGESAFSDNEITSVIIPNSVMNIGNFAFAYNKLASVKIIGKSSSSEFQFYSPNWGWATGYNDSNIIWNASA